MRLRDKIRNSYIRSIAMYPEQENKINVSADGISNNASENEDLSSMFRNGMMYYKGDGVEQYDTLAFDMFEKAAMLGNAAVSC